MARKDLVAVRILELPGVFGNTVRRSLHPGGRSYV